MSTVIMPNGTRGPRPSNPPSVAEIAKSHQNLHAAAQGLVQLGTKRRKNIVGGSRKGKKGSRKGRKGSRKGKKGSRKNRNGRKGTRKN